MPNLSDFPQTSDPEFVEVMKLVSHMTREYRQQLSHLTFLLVTCFKDGQLNRERLLLLHGVLEEVKHPFFADHFPESADPQEKP